MRQGTGAIRFLLFSLIISLVFLCAAGCQKRTGYPSAIPPNSSLAASVPKGENSGTDPVPLPEPDSSPADSSTVERERSSYVVDMEADLDWDGEPEWIVFVAEWEKHPYVKVDGYTWMAEEINKYTYHYPFLDVLDVDGDGRAEIIAGADTGACGGYGGIVLHILKWKNGKLTELPLPTFDMGQGCDLEGKFLSPQKMKFYFPATDSEQTMDIKIENSFLQDEAWKNEELYIDPIYAYHLYSGSGDSRGLVLEQYICAGWHMNGIAILYSRVEWVNGEMRITHQECEALND